MTDGENTLPASVPERVAEASKGSQRQPASHEPDPFAAPRPRWLRPELPVVQQRIPRGKTHRYSLFVSTDSYLRLAVRGRGAQLQVSVRDGDGRELGKSFGSGPVHTVELLLQREAELLVEVRHLGDGEAIGGYDLQSLLAESPEPYQRLRARAAADEHRGQRALELDLEELSGDGYDGQQEVLRAAAISLGQALRGWRQAGDREGVARSRLGRGEALMGLGDTVGAARSLQAAGETFADLGLGLNRAAADDLLAQALLQLGKPQESRQLLDRAVAHRHGAGWVLAASRSGLARAELDRRQGRWESAEAGFRQVLRWLEGRSDPELESEVLHRWGALLREVGRGDEARTALRRALALRRQQSDEKKVAESLELLGLVALEDGRPSLAFFYLRSALDAYGQRRDLLGRVASLDGLGLVYHRLGAEEEALEAHFRAHRLLDSMPPGGFGGGGLGGAAQRVSRHAHWTALRARTHHNLGWQLFLHGRPAEALELHFEALSLFQQEGDRDGEAAALLGLARCHRSLGQRVEARRLLGLAIDRIEGDPPSMRDLSLGAFYLARHQDHYRELVELLMQESREGARGAAAEALEVAERARGRSLLHTLAAAVRVHPGGAARERQLLRQLDRELSTLPAESLERQTPENRARLARLVAELRVLRASEGNEIAAPSSLSLDQMMRQVLDEQTALLFFHLAPERSYLWVVDSAGLEVHELPGAEKIGHLARQLHQALARGDRELQAVRARHRLEDLGSILLPRFLPRHRLLVVADGPLHYVPFAALLRRGASGQARYLVEDHEIVHMASVSALARVRRPGIPGPGAALVVADPVVSADDPRLPHRPKGLRPLPRLLHSRQEAQQVLAAAGRGDVLLGFEARPRALLRMPLEGYRYLHFAVHGELEEELPDLSRLVFSRFDPSGRELHLSSLYAHEVYQLRLQADLVVLSACRTALGQEVHGEGLVGLTRAFFAAGASAVMVSLWDLDDRAAAQVMANFYPALVEPDLGASGALRKAQLALLRDSGGAFADPYYWAAFQVQGRWSGSSERSWSPSLPEPSRSHHRALLPPPPRIPRQPAAILHVAVGAAP
ncbi:MAG: CHAT domain-containing tetratricopeptide repeat protein [Acidobacteriota bacterium]